MRGIRHSDRVLIVGKTKLGKTTLAGYIADQMDGVRQTVIDPKAMLDFGVPIARTPAELDLSAPLSHYIPSTLERAEYDELFWRLWRTPGPRLLRLDESAGPTEANYCPAGLKFWAMQGDKHEKGLIACTQRPVDIAVCLRTECEHVFILVPPTTAADLRTIAGDIGREPQELADELAWLLANEGLYSHLWYCRETNELQRCAPLPADVLPAQRAGGPTASGPTTEASDRGTTQTDSEGASSELDAAQRAQSTRGETP